MFWKLRLRNNNSCLDGRCALRYVPGNLSYGNDTFLVSTPLMAQSQLEGFRHVK